MIQIVYNSLPARKNKGATTINVNSAKNKNQKGTTTISETPLGSMPVNRTRAVTALVAMIKLKAIPDQTASKSGTEKIIPQTGTTVRLRNSIEIFTKQDKKFLDFGPTWCV